MIDKRRNKCEMPVNLDLFIKEIEKKGYKVTLHKQHYSKSKLNISIEPGFMIENFEFDHAIVLPIKYANGLFAQYVEQMRYFKDMRIKHGETGYDDPNA